MCNVNYEELNNKMDEIFEEYKSFLFNYLDGLKIIDYKRILITSILNRSLALIEAYKTLLKSNNLMALNSLSRLQIDNCIFIYGISMLIKSGLDIDALGVAILSKNKKLSEYKIGKQKLYDTYIISELNKKYGMRIEEMYNFYCRFVHFSDSAVFSSTQALDNDTIELALSKDFTRFKKHVKENANSFIEISKFILLLLKNEWKDIPNGNNLIKT